MARQSTEDTLAALTRPSRNPDHIRRVKARERVLETVEQRNDLRDRLAANRVELRRRVRDARDAGWGVTNLARVIGVTRRAVYDLLAESDDGEGRTNRKNSARDG